MLTNNQVYRLREQKGTTEKRKLKIVVTEKDLANASASLQLRQLPTFLDFRFRLPANLLKDFERFKSINPHLNHLLTSYFLNLYEDGSNLLHAAASSGDLQTLKLYCDLLMGHFGDVEAYKILKNQANQANDLGFTPHAAILNYNYRKINKCLQLMLNSVPAGIKKLDELLKELKDSTYSPPPADLTRFDHFSPQQDFSAPELGDEKKGSSQVVPFSPIIGSKRESTKPSSFHEYSLFLPSPRFSLSLDRQNNDVAAPKPKSFTLDSQDK